MQLLSELALNQRFASYAQPLRDHSSARPERPDAKRVIGPSDEVTSQAHVEVPEPQAVPMPRFVGPHTLQHGRAPMAGLALSADEATVLVRHIPAGCVQGQLLVEWQLVGKIDLFFMPMMPQKNLSLGYVIINFLSMEDARDFHRRWQGVSLAHTLRARPLDVRRSKIQGFYPTLNHIVQSMKGRRKWKEGSLPLGFNGYSQLDMQRIIQDISQ
mmetsp:Transcript_4190/g.13404  ORF Transcript_4190/g.13404 Transcript_4190/m.13404 type:complete len:214 (-) Transcript_4190:52-693(-)